MIRFFFTAVAVLGILSRCEGAAFCSGGKLTETEINDQILNVINNDRMALVKGEQLNGKTQNKLPAGKNMNKLSWSCELEIQAINAADSTCPDDPPSGPADKALIYTADYDYGKDIPTILRSILGVIEGASLTDVSGDVKYSGEASLANYADLMRSTTTQIGCHMNKCAIDPLPRYSLYCLTDQTPINSGDVIYQRSTSTSCTCDQQGFVCDADGFCVAAETTPASSTSSTTSTSTTSTTSTTTTTRGSEAVLPAAGAGGNTICSSNTGMTDSLRTKFLDMHNYRRSLVALGKCPKNNGNLLPKAKNMARMNYNCALEAEAIEYAKQCPLSGTSGGTRGENFYRGSSAGISTFEDGVNKVVTSWWKVVRQYPGIGQLAMFRANHVGTPITSFTQMAWATSNRLGCSIARCASDIVAVCRYLEKGNIVEKNVYVPGNTCASCRNNCVSSLGLCI